MTCLGRASCPAISFQSRPKFGRVCPYFMRSFCICERILKPSSGEFDGGEFRDGPSMSPQRRTTITRSALWIAVPTFVVSLAVAASLKAGVLAALVVGLIGAGLVGAFAEVRTRSPEGGGIKRVSPRPLPRSCRARSPAANSARRRKRRRRFRSKPSASPAPDAWPADRRRLAARSTMRSRNGSLSAACAKRSACGPVATISAPRRRRSSALSSATWPNRLLRGRRQNAFDQPVGLRAPAIVARQHGQPHQILRSHRVRIGRWRRRRWNAAAAADRRRRRRRGNSRRCRGRRNGRQRPAARPAPARDRPFAGRLVERQRRPDHGGEVAGEARQTAAFRPARSGQAFDFAPFAAQQSRRRAWPKSTSPAAPK